MGNLSACNGWEHWYYENESGELHIIDKLREQIRMEIDYELRGNDRNP